MANANEELFASALNGRSSRRTLIQRGGAMALAGVFAPTSLLACTGSDDDTSAAAGANGAATDIATQFAWVKNVEWAGFWIADSEGYFEQEGVAPEFFGGGPNAPEPTQVVTGGRAQVGVSSDILVFFDAVRKGADLVMFATDFQVSPLGLMWLPESGIETVADLVGKRIGGDQDSAGSLDAMFKLAGEPAEYELVPIGFDPSPLVEGQIDAMVCFVTNQPLILEDQGLNPVAKTYADLGMPLYADVLYTTRDFLEGNREALAGYVRALRKGWEMNIEDPELAARLVVDEYGIDLGSTFEAELAQNKAQIPLLTSPDTDEHGLLWVNQELLGGEMYEILAEIGDAELPPVEQVFDPSILEMAAENS